MSQREEKIQEQETRKPRPSDAEERQQPRKPAPPRKKER